MDRIRYFRDFDAWQAAMDLAVKTHNLSAQLPAEHRFELAAQLCRAATSIPSNIAEGHAQRMDKVFLRHVLIALGSLAELETQIELVDRLRALDPTVTAQVAARIQRTGQLLHGLSRALRRRIAERTNARSGSRR
jgi:four helix bundle protein